MPTDHQDDDKALSDLLQRIEPPKSPSQLDETILKRARQKAEALRATNDSKGWMAGAQWRSAIAVFSVAAVAISVSLQFFTDEQLDDVVQFVAAQAPALDSPTRQRQEEVAAAADQVALAFEQNIAVDADAPQAQAPTELIATAELLELAEEDQVASDAGTRGNDFSQLARSATASRTAAPTQGGLANSTANPAQNRTVENREQTSVANAVDPALLDLLAAVLLTEQTAENELGDLQQREQTDLVQQLLATFDQLSAEGLELAQQQFAERRSALDDDTIPDDLDAAVETIRP